MLLLCVSLVVHAILMYSMYHKKLNTDMIERSVLGFLISIPMGMQGSHHPPHP